MTIKNFEFNNEATGMLYNALDLDGNMGSINLRVEVLQDISVKMKHLQEDMDQSVHEGNQKFTFTEHHREVRILAELLFYTVNELTKNNKEARTTADSIIAKAKAMNGGSGK
ncbi:hypothetical protein [Planococcus beigongshangi]|uniref:hypothetical protein n=1 Tax=Planococcus beigongshangi TaxID=2782536 RepID=UPI00193C7E8A|nr:hypothetical protein [Planococcus beigongshangi]